MTTTQTIEFTDNKAALAKPDHFITIEVNIEAVISSWKQSLYSFEWLDQDGQIKSMQDLSETEQEKRQAVENQIKNTEALEKPVLGIGMIDNIEIGSGRATLLTLASKGHKTLPVHIPKSCESDFKEFLAEV